MAVTTAALSRSTTKPEIRIVSPASVRFALSSPKHLTWGSLDDSRVNAETKAIA